METPERLVTLNCATNRRPSVTIMIRNANAI